MRYRALLAAILVLLPSAALAQDRVALVIGNAGYREVPLRNAVNDARAISHSLGKLGFEVTLLVDADRERMARAIQDFTTKLDRDTAGLFYFAGHGIQARGHNYLIPVDADLETELALRFESIDVGGVLEDMELAGNRVNFLILDACRNNPFERRFRGGSRGLAAIDAAKGTLIAYATAPGSVAEDGAGRNGVYTAALLSALEVANLKAEEVFKRVRVAVADRTRNRQVPWESSSLTGEFVFNMVAAGTPTVTPSTNVEALFWASIKDSDDPDDFTAYLEQFPGGIFTRLARNRLDAFGSPPTSSDPLEETPTTALEQLSHAAPDAARERSREPYNVWILRGGEFVSGGYSTGGEEHLPSIRRAILSAIGRNASFTIERRYSDDGEFRRHPINGSGLYGEGSLGRRSPRLDFVYKHSAMADVDAVMAYWLRIRTSNAPVDVDLFLIDVKGKRLHATQANDATVGEGVAALLAEFVADRRE